MIDIGGSPAHLLTHCGLTGVLTRDMVVTVAEAAARGDNSRDRATALLLLSAIRQKPFYYDAYHCNRSPNGLPAQLWAGYAAAHGIGTNERFIDVGTGQLKLVEDGAIVLRDAAVYHSLPLHERPAYLAGLHRGAHVFGTAACRAAGDPIAISQKDEALYELKAIEAALGHSIHGRISFGMGSMQGVVGSVVYTAPIGVAAVVGGAPPVARFTRLQ
jgi:hypothetical protein